MSACRTAPTSPAAARSLDAEAFDGDQPLITNFSGLSVVASPRNTLEAELPGYATLDSTALGSLNVLIGTATLTGYGTVTINEDLAGNASQAPASFNAVVTFADDTGLDLDSTTLGPATPTVTGLDVDFGDLAPTLPVNTYASTVAVDATDPGGIQEQTVVLSFEADYAPSAPQADRSGAIALGFIEREGDSAGPFEWVGDANAVNFSVFRHLGFDPADLPNVSVIVDNATDESFDGEYPLDLSGFTVSSGGEVIMNSAQIASQIGDFGRADLEFFFEGSGYDTERFIVGPNGTLTTYDGDFAASCSGTTASTSTPAFQGIDTDDADTDSDPFTGTFEDQAVFAGSSSGTVSMSCFTD